MDFTLSPQQEMLKDTVRRFAERDIDPKVKEMEEADEVSMDIIEKMAELGLLGIVIPKEYEGTEMGHVARVVAIEEISRISAAAAHTLGVLHVGQGPVLYYGSREQKEKWLPSMARGEKLATLALTEPSGGSDVRGLQTTVKQEDDSYIINGRKCFITNSHIAHLFAVVAKDEKGELSCYMVDKSTSGLILGREEKKFGLMGCNTGEVIFDNCSVPKENLVGEEGKGLRVALSSIDNLGRPGIGAIALGILRRCLEEAVKFAKERVLYGKPIIKLQATQWKITDIYMDYEVSRLLNYYAACLRDKRQRCDAENALAKFWSTEAAIRSAVKAISVLGGYGSLRDYVPQRLLRDAQPLTSSAGTSDIMRLVMMRKASDIV
ncbi:MAG: acyl-CoA dehydrogenase [Nitrososphaeria archaeon]|nr:acyl-CoA dehydrogenase [Nitrososphaeria archaeon]NIQ33728.1 acyl-CoA dehydrogenase [Nitrososphaeria archaeon]